MRTRLGTILKNLFYRSAATLVGLGVPLVFALTFWPALLQRGDRALAQLHPYIEQELATALERPVSIGVLHPELSIQTLTALLRTPERFPTWTVRAERVTLGARPDEQRWIGQRWLVRVREVRAVLAPGPALQGKFATAGVTQVEVFDPEAAVARLPNGRISVETFLPTPKTPPDPTQPPFQTRVIVHGGRVQLRDFAVSGQPLPQVNAVTIDRAQVDLTGPRTLWFTGRLRATPGSATVQRLRGPVVVRGSLTRGAPGERPDSPAPDAPNLTVFATVAGADLTYWVPYALPLPRSAPRLRRGIADLELTLLGERPASPKAPLPPLHVTAKGRVRELDLILPDYPRFPVTGVQADFLFRENQLQATFQGTALRTPFQGALALAPLGGTATQPQLLAKLTLAPLPVRALRAALPTLTLPPELQLGETIRLGEIIASGPLSSPRVETRLLAADAQWPGVPRVTQLQAALRYDRGEARVDDLHGTLVGGGTVSGSLRYRFLAPTGALLPTPRRSGAVALQARDIPLASLAPLQFPDDRLRLRGRGDADIVGTLTGTRLQADLRARARQLQIGMIAFPHAAAAATLDGTRWSQATATLTSPHGLIQLNGNGTFSGPLALTAQVVGFDLKPLAAALGLPPLHGIASASVQVQGTPTNPTITLTDVTVLQPKLALADRLLEGDVLFAPVVQVAVGAKKAATITIPFDQPVQFHRFPAIATAAGTIRAIADQPAQLDLSLRAQSLDLDELLPTALAPLPHYGDLAASDLAVLDRAQRWLGWAATPPPPISGTVLSVSAELTGDSKTPHLIGTATLGRSLIGPYPIDSGEARFTVLGKSVQVDQIALETGAGRITGTVALSERGDLSGELNAPEVNLRALSFLTDPVAAIAGTVGVKVTIAGTRTAPLATAQVISNGEVDLAGIPLQSLQMEPLQFAGAVADDGSFSGKFALPQLTLRQGSSQLTIRDVTYALATGAFSGKVALQGMKLEELLPTLRNSHLGDGTGGDRAIAALAAIPEGAGGTLAMETAFQGQWRSEGLVHKELDARMTVDALKLGKGSPYVGTLTAAASLRDDRLTFNNGILTLTDPANPDEPAILRLAPRLNPQTQARERSWIGLAENGRKELEFHLAADSNEVPLDIVKVFYPDLRVQGKATFALTADGTADAPRIATSLSANDLVLLPPVDPTKGLAPTPFVLNLARARIDLVGDATSGLKIVVQDGLVQHSDDQLSFGGTFPFDRAAGRVAASRPVDFSLRSDGIQLASLADYLQAKNLRAAGKLVGNIALQGSLNDPLLSGQVRLAEGTLQFPNPTAKKNQRDVLNPVSNIDLQVDFQGREIRFTRAQLTLGPAPGGPANKRKVSAGTLALVSPDGMTPSRIVLENLEDFTKLFTRQSAEGASAKLEGTFDLLARFDGFTPDSANLTSVLMSAAKGEGLGESFTGQFDGDVRIQGPLLAPRISTAAGVPLRVTNTVFQLPARQVPESTSKSALTFNPAFDIEFKMDRAELKSPAGILPFSFRGVGGLKLTGDLSSPRLDGSLNTIGGYYSYVLATFSVRRDGEIGITYAQRYSAGQTVQQFDIRLRDVYADGKIQVSASAVNTAQNRSTSGLFSSDLGSGLRNLAPGTRLKITARFNGLIQLGDVDTRNAAERPVHFESDPPISESEIISLLAFNSQLQQLAGGGAQKAFDETASLIGGGLIQRAFNPFIDQFRGLFGLEDFSVDYAPDGTANIYLLRRLNEPLDRFTLEFRQTITTRSGISSGQQPRFFSLNYELFELRRNRRYQPRFTLGFSSNEQRDNRFYLRGTIHY